MGLDSNKIPEILKNRKKQTTISKAIRHQDRIKFHAETKVSASTSSSATDFLNWVSSLIPLDKFKTFGSLFRYPVKTNGVTGIVFDKLSRVFDGRNPAFNYQFMNPEQRDDWEYYRQVVLKEPTVWQTKGWEYFKTEINSILIVDLPDEEDEDPSDPYPQPYFYWLTIDKVIDFRVDTDTGIMEYIIFAQDKNRIAIIDDEFYRIAQLDKNGNIESYILENPHDLGYCPARFFWNEPLSLKDPEIKMHPLSKELDSLDWYLAFSGFKKHLDLHGAYPIFSGYEEECDYSNEEANQECNKGFLMSDGSYMLNASGALVKCPKCGTKNLAGPGSYIEVPIPAKDSPDLRNPVQMLTVDTASLQYNVTESERLRAEIISSIVGVDSEPTKEAINEKQVTAQFESQSTVLNRIKKGFEEAQSFIDATICKMRYGNAFVSANVNLGTEFYVADPQELREQYKMAKDSGAGDSELDGLLNQILETQYRSNPTELQRMIILSELEPYRHYTRDEVMSLYEKNLISETELRIKLNFSSFVRRFERENTNILEFGINIPYDSKIEVITQKFKDYANETR